jgi:hypothetical protein
MLAVGHGQFGRTEPWPKLGSFFKPGNELPDFGYPAEECGKDAFIADLVAVNIGLPQRRQWLDRR